MSKQAIAIALLVVTLVVTNVWWLYHAIDFGITHTYQMAQCEMDAEILGQLKAILPVVAGQQASREHIVTAARVDPRDEPFEKDGAVWIGQLGLKFAPDGRFIGVADIQE